MANKKKVGIMGGTFNPIHLGHLILGEWAYEQFELDKVQFMPSKNPPHKQGIYIVSNEHRSKMVELAIEGNPHFELSKAELEREGLTYTVDTLRQLVTKNTDTEYYFIIGGDSLFQFESWREPATIVQLAHVIATSRNRVSEEEINHQIEHLNQRLGGEIEFLRTPEIGISSNEIRSRLMKKQTIAYLVPKTVEEYIKENQLYLNLLQRND